MRGVEGHNEVVYVDRMGSLGVCTFGWDNLMCANAPRNCWVLMSGYDVSVPQGAMGILGAGSSWG